MASRHTGIHQAIEGYRDAADLDAGLLAGPSVSCLVPATGLELPRVEVIHELPEQARHCTGDGTPLKVIGEAVSEELHVVPARIEVIHHVRRKYACPACEDGVQLAPLPAKLLPKSNASATLLAYVATAKYQDALPLYRQSRIFARHGAEIPRNTLARWMVQAGERLTPLGKALHYLDGQWQRLTRFLEDGLIPLDNNPAENAIRHFVVGRKNWLFSQTPSGAHASAAIYSLIETAKANGLSPYAYLQFVFETLPTLGDDDSLDALLPWQWKATLPI